MVKKRLGKSKKTTRGKDFYLTVLSEFKINTSLPRIKKKLGLKKQELYYYTSKLVKLGLLEQRGNGWYELTDKGKDPTKYGTELKEDSIRGHAFVWTIELKHVPALWDDRINILKDNKINFNLVGALKSTPRIKVLGRKVWLCNNHIRIFDKEKCSYYGDTAKESQINGKVQAFRIIRTLETKLGINLSKNTLKFRKEHYAIIKNDLAKHHNEKGIILRISDDDGEWLLIDDSLGSGGELETVGKKAFETNPLVQNWYNDHKKHSFKVTSSYVIENLNNLINSQKNTEERMNELILVTQALVQELGRLKER